VPASCRERKTRSKRLLVNRTTGLLPRRAGTASRFVAGTRELVLAPLPFIVVYRRRPMSPAIRGWWARTRKASSRRWRRSAASWQNPRLRTSPE